MHPSEEEDSVSEDEVAEESSQENEVDEEKSDSEESNDEEEEKEPWVVDVWKQMRDESDNTNASFLDVYKDNVIFSKSLKRDETHKKIMETFAKAQTEDDMDFEEALDFAVDRRKFLIQREFEDEDDSDVRYTLNDDTEMDV